MSRKEAQIHVEQILKDSIDTVTLHPTKRMLTAQSNSDHALADSYHGRELLELLQNADDAFIGNSGNKKSRVLIDYSHNVLRISNVGKTFDKESIERLCQGNASSKGIQYIGNKGIGFRSLLNWAEEIRIYSGDYAVGFSNEFAAGQLEHLIHDFDKIREEVAAKPSITFPVLWAPFWVDGAPEEGFDTTIEILIGDNTQDDEWSVENQINEFDDNVLLFLQNLTEVTIRENGVETLYRKEEGEKKDLVTNCVKKYRVGKQKELLDSKEYYFFRREDEVIQWNDSASLIKASIAIPVDFHPIQSSFYTFFPVKGEDNPFPALMHCTFLLTPNRNNFVNHTSNSEMMRKLLAFYVQTVCANFEKLEFGNTQIDLLIPSISYFRFGVKDYYNDLCKANLKLLNVNDRFIPIAGGVKLYGDIPSVFRGPQFEDLCKPIEKQEHREFVNALIGGKPVYDRDDLAIKIVACTMEWTIAQRVDVFYWWSSHQQRLGYGNHISPLLLKDNSGDWINDCSEQVFVPSETRSFDIPVWVSIKILHPEYVLNLIKRCCCGFEDALELLNRRNYFKFRNLDLIELLPSMISSIKEDSNRAAEFIRWCRKNSASDFLTSSDKIFPCMDGTVNSAESIFLDKPYCENPLKDILLSSGIHQLCPPEILLNDGEVFEENKDSLMRFLSRVPFVKYPEIHDGELRFYEDRDYEYLPLQKFSKNLNEQLNRDKNHEGHESKCWVHKVEVQTIDKIQDILEKLPTSNVLMWLYDDNDSSRKLLSYVLKAESSCEIEYLYGNKQRSRTFRAKSYHFLRYVFTYSKWICLDDSGERFAPCECKFTKSSLEKSLLKSAVSDDNLKIWAGICKTTSHEIKKLLTTLGCSDSYMNLPPEHFYDLLLKLPEMENVAESRKLSYKIYNNCVESLQKIWGDFDANVESAEVKGLIGFINHESAHTFAKRGKLVCSKDLLYHPVSELYYADFPALNPQGLLFLDLPIKKDVAGLIKNVFKLHKYERTWDEGLVTREEDVSPLNECFQREWLDFVPFILCLSPDSKIEKYLEALRSLKIKLISRLWDESGSDISSLIEGYHLIVKDDTNYIFIGDSAKLNRFNLSLVVTQILSSILTDVSQKQLDRCSELFRSDEDSRRGLIRQEIAGEVLLEECRYMFLAANAEQNSLKLFLIDRKIDFEPVSEILDLLYNGLPLVLGNQERLSVFLQENGLDIVDFKNVLNQQNISVLEYNKDRLDKVLRQRRYQFDWAMWLKVSKSSLEEKRRFRQKLDSIKVVFNDATVENSVKFDPESAADKIFEGVFGVLPAVVAFEHIEEIFKKNRKMLVLPVGSSKKLEDFLDEEYKSLLYFDVTKVQEDLNEWALEDVDEKNDAHEGVKKSTVEVSFNEKLVSSSAIYNTTKVDGVRSRKSSSRSQNESNLENQGDSAEFLIVEMLRKREILEICEILDNEEYSVEWVSMAAERQEHADGDDSLGYDIQLNNRSGKTLYVDVKSHSGEDCTFRMSANEIRFAEAHATANRDEYRIIFVANVGSGKYNVSVLPRDFLTNESFKREYLDVRFFYE